MQKQTNTEPEEVSMWIQDHPPMVEYLRSTSWHGKLRARLPIWLGGRPASASDSESKTSKGGLVSYETGELSLFAKLQLAETNGRKTEAASIKKRMLEIKEARAKIRRVS